MGPRPVVIIGGLIVAALIAVPAILSYYESNLAQPFQIAFSSAAAAVAALSAIAAVRAAQVARDQTQLTRRQMEATLRPFVGIGVPFKRQEDFNRNVWQVPVQNFGTVPATVNIGAGIQTQGESVTLRAGATGTGLTGFVGGSLMPGQREQAVVEIQHRSILSDMISDKGVRLTLSLEYSDAEGIINSRTEQTFKYAEPMWVLIGDSA